MKNQIEKIIIDLYELGRFDRKGYVYINIEKNLNVMNFPEFLFEWPDVFEMYINKRTLR